MCVVIFDLCLLVFISSCVASACLLDRAMVIRFGCRLRVMIRAVGIRAMCFVTVRTSVEQRRWLLITRLMVFLLTLVSLKIRWNGLVFLFGRFRVVLICRTGRDCGVSLLYRLSVFSRWCEVSVSVQVCLLKLLVVWV